MKPKKLIKELLKQLAKDKENLVIRLKLAAAYRDDGRIADAVEIYCSVATAYHESGRPGQAMAVCKSVLEIDPSQPAALALLQQIELARRGQGPAEVDESAAQGRWVPSLAQAENLAEVKRSALIGSQPPEGGGAGSRRRAPQNTIQELDRAGPPERFSGPLLTPTPLPMPIAPHEADEDSLVVSDSLERYKLPLDPEPSGDLPEVSLPGDLPPLDDDLLPVADEGFEESEPTRLAGDSRPRRVPTVEVVEAQELDVIEVVEIVDVGDAAVEDASVQDESDEDGNTMPIDLPSEDELMDAAKGDGAAGAGRSSTDVDAEAEHQRGHGEWNEEPTNPRASHDRVELEDAVPLEPPTAEHTTPVPCAPPGMSETMDAAPEVAAPSAITRLDTTPHVIHDDMPLGEAFHVVALAERAATDPGSTAEVQGPLSIFSALPAEALNDLAESIALRRCDAGERIVGEGEPGRACYVIVSGEVQVLRREARASEDDAPAREPAAMPAAFIEIARLTDGALFGEHALLAGRRHRATVRALSECHVYEIPRRLLRELAATYAEVGPLLDGFYRERLIGSLLASAPYLRDLPPERLDDVRERFELVRCESGQVLVAEGTRGGGLFLVVQGAVEVTRRISARRAALLATLGEGAYIADMSFAAGDLAHATVRAAGPAELAVLSPRDLRDLVEARPEPGQRTLYPGQRRELASHQLLSGDTIMV